MNKSPEVLKEIRAKLLAAEVESGLWETAVSANRIPDGLTRGDDAHLAYLTLVFAISRGRKPEALWQAARQLFQEAPALFAPSTLAYQNPKEITPSLMAAKVIKKKGDGTVWQRIGKALMMRAGGSVQKLLADHEYDAKKLLDMLEASKTTYPVLSGEQTAPRWLWGLAQAGGQPIEGAARLAVPVTPSAARALASLEIEAEQVSAEIFTVLDALGRHGCRRQKAELACPAAADCPVAKYCQFGMMPH